MALIHIGVDPTTPNSGCPNVWYDDEDGSVVLQGPKVEDDNTLAQVRATGLGIHPDLDPIPPHEGVIRLPARMFPILRKAIDDRGQDD